MRKVLRGYAIAKNGSLILIGTIPPVARRERRRLVRQGATIFKEEAVR